ncbi:MAG TPA: hypothetical protein P5232_02235 [Candidatus Moranbacteria bacterium]|nr:hypothetical protein [Candidatus Moranbacteria bacterium]
MSTINYLSILKKAWSITWTNKYLWWFGFFATLGSCGGINIFFDGVEENLDPVKEQQILEFFSKNFHWIIAIAIILFLLFIIFLILGTIGRGALISSIGKNLKEQHSNFKISWQEGKKNFWKIFAINFSLGLFILLTLLILIAPVATLFLNKNYIIGGILAFIAILIFIPIAILTCYLKTYGYIYAVLGKLKFWPAIENAYNLFAKNLTSSVLMSLIFIPLGIIFMLIIFVAIPILFFVFLILCGIAYLALGKIAAIIFGAIGIIIFLTYALFVRSIFEVFAQTVWILFFHKIATPKVKELVVEEEKEKEIASKPLPIIEAKKIPKAEL